MSYRLGVLAGDGIGPEIVEATLRVLEALQQRDSRLRFGWLPLPIGWEAIRTMGTATPESTVEALEKCDAWILGPHDSASYPAAEREKLNPSGTLRHHFDLYANIRPARAYPGLPAASPKMDLVVVRENTEGLYTDRNMAWGIGEFMPTPDVALTVGKITRQGSERIARTAFALARQRRRKVAIVHKANVIRKAYGLFLETCREVGREFPEVAIEDYHIDAMAALLVRRGADFDVVLTTNMFGDILSDLTGELAGSLGMAPSVNAGAGRAMAQAAHGSAPDIAGKGIANPVGLILSAAMLLTWLAGERQDAAAAEAGQAIEQAVAKTLEAGPRTRDLGGTAGTQEFTSAILRHLIGS
ncbi:MAG TPA: isocitrate/isopropylmalate dehydrogenase family protein [Candidatus Acidoferrum sp.]|nr:isocitrate/isopropylmalate dehydrogenase family protein [Candidatus Acidoferrum sp.]